MSKEFNKFVFKPRNEIDHKHLVHLVRAFIIELKDNLMHPG